jgi:hypothetical protein
LKLFDQKGFNQVGYIDFDQVVGFFGGKIKEIV